MAALEIRQRLTATSAAGLALLSILGLTAAAAQARTYVVDSSWDLPASDPSDGECRTDPTPWYPHERVCTLRAAIQSANSLPGHDIIELPLSQRISLPDPPITHLGDGGGDLDIYDDVTIRGPALGRAEIRSRLDEGVENRVFHVQNGARLALHKVEIAGGQSFGGAGIMVEDGGRLEGDNIVLRENRGELGSAIQVNGAEDRRTGLRGATVHLRDSWIIDNSPPLLGVHFGVSSTVYVSGGTLVMERTRVLRNQNVGWTSTLR